MRIVFMGSADFGIPALEKLIEEKFAIAGIVTAPPRHKGRGLKIEESPVAQYAVHRGLKPILTPEDLKNTDFLTTLSKLHADLFIVIAYRILPSEVFKLPSLGTVNVHASFLPKFRGPAPIQRAIEAGEKQTGVTVFRIDKGIDTGNIIVKRELSIRDQETTPQLYDRLSILGADALIDACKLLQEGNATYIQQNDAYTTHAPKLKKEESWIDWEMPASVLFNKIRAFKPFPGTCAMINDKRLGIEWALPIDGSSGMESGTVCGVSSEWFEVQCRDSRLRILEVKPAGKKHMQVSAFLNGAKIEKGTKLG